LAYLGLFRLIPSHKILFILPAEHYSFYQPNNLSLVVTRAPVAPQVLGLTPRVSEFLRI
jgi:hypothetical protein